MNKFKVGSDQMRDVKGNDMVDKTNGMSSPKGIEKIKASANKAKKETNKPEDNIKLMTMVAKTVRGLKKMEPTGEKMKKLSLKEGKEYNGVNFEIGDIVTVDPEVAPKVGLEPNKTYTIQDFRETPNSKGLPNSIDVVLDKAKYLDTYNLYPAKGGVNIKYITKTDVNENNQINEVKAGSLSIGDDFTLAGDLGKFVKGEKVTVYSITPWGNALKIMLSNGKDKDDFYIDKNDEL